MMDGFLMLVYMTGFVSLLTIGAYIGERYFD